MRKGCAAVCWHRLHYMFLKKYHQTPCDELDYHQTCFSSRRESLERTSMWRNGSETGNSAVSEWKRDPNSKVVSEVTNPRFWGIRRSRIESHGMQHIKTYSSRYTPLETSVVFVIHTEMSHLPPKKRKITYSSSILDIPWTFGVSAWFPAKSYLLYPGA